MAGNPENAPAFEEFSLHNTLISTDELLPTLLWRNLNGLTVQLNLSSVKYAVMSDILLGIGNMTFVTYYCLLDNGDVILANKIFDLQQ